MKTLSVILFLTIVGAAAPYAHASESSGDRNYFPVHYISEKTTLPSKYIRLADDYCNSRCDQRFNYCRYHGESLDTCSQLLITCRKDC
jgi:hypothetical protein